MASITVVVELKDDTMETLEQVVASMAVSAGLPFNSGKLYPTQKANLRDENGSVVGQWRVSA